MEIFFATFPFLKKFRNTVITLRKKIDGGAVFSPFYETFSFHITLVDLFLVSFQGNRLKIDLSMNLKRILEEF